MTATRLVATTTLRLAGMDITASPRVITPASMDDAGVGAGTATAVGAAMDTALVGEATERAGAAPGLWASVVACAPDDAERINFG
jgi:hypothetical protein